MDYSKLSDFEINRSVGEVILKGRWACKPGTAANNTDSWYYGSVDQFVTPYPELPDYCNNPADAWPIIVQNGISMIIHWDEDGESIDDSTWTATTNINKSWCDEREPGFESTDKNPLRAAMIVFLMMQGDE